MASASTGKIRWGYGVDDVAFYAPVTLAPNEIVCPECEGDGRVKFDNGTDGFSRPHWDVCPTCDGRGELQIETLEEE